MGEPAGAERRKYARLETDAMISVAPMEAPERLAVSKDVSVGGIRFQAIGCEIHLGEVLRVTFNVEDRTLTAVGKVVWATEIDPITSEIGLEFMDIDPEALAVLEEHERG